MPRRASRRAHPDDGREHAQARLAALRRRPSQPATEGPSPAGSASSGSGSGSSPGRVGWVPDVSELAGRVGAAAADRLPVTVRGGRLSLTSRPAAAIAVLALLSVLLSASYLLRSRPHGDPVPEPGSGARPGQVAVAPAGRSRAGAESDGPTETTPGPTEARTTAPGGASVRPLLVHVAGRVRRPGLVRLPAGARVADALAAAGGVTRDGEPASVNLARPLADGEQIVVGQRGSAPAAGAPSPPEPTAGAVVDLNAATSEQLQQLPGVGPVLAQRILDWRARNGRFSTVDELREVSGVGERRFADLRDKVRV